ncbi:MAG: hypothetical protein K0B37_11445 [Bacteroidales bacterium]|nr:hypothetical protein [Bacteroidales bacterium]
MKQDKALRKTLSQFEPQLPFGFHDKVMKKIHLEAELQKKRNYILDILVAGTVSFLLFAGAIYTLNNYLGYNILKIFQGLNIPSQHGLPVSFYICMSFIVLLLLGMDFKLRQIIKKGPGKGPV